MKNYNSSADQVLIEKKLYGKEGDEIFWPQKNHICMSNF